MKIPSSPSIEMRPLLPEQKQGESSHGAAAPAGTEEVRWSHGSFTYRKHRVPVEPSGYQGVYLSRNDTAKFHATARDALRQLDSTPAGATVLQQLAALNEMNPTKKVIVECQTDPNRGSHTSPGWERPRWPLRFLNSLSMTARQGQDDFVPYIAGPGADSATVRFNPAQGLRFEPGDEYGKLDESVAFVTLGHELIHASHELHGDRYRTIFGDPRLDFDSPAAEEEIRTTGIGPWRAAYPSENAIRHEHGLHEAPSYAGNKGESLRPPAERNSEHTARRLQELGATTGRPLGRVAPKAKED